MYWLSECPLSAVTYRFELQCQSKAGDVVVLSNLSLLESEPKQRLNASFHYAIPVEQERSSHFWKFMASRILDGFK